MFCFCSENNYLENPGAQNSSGVPSALELPGDDSTERRKTSHKVCKVMSMAAMLRCNQLKLLVEDSISHGLRRGVCTAITK